MKRFLTIVCSALLVGAAGCAQSSAPRSLPASGLAPQNSEAATGSSCPCYSLLHSFSGTDGRIPGSDLTYVNGAFYGTTDLGGVGKGVVYSMTPGGVEKVLHAFKGAPDGSKAQSGPLYEAGLFYVPTIEGGANGKGAVYSLSPDGTEKALHSFQYTGQVYVEDARLANLNGTFYGEIARGGKFNRGLVYSITPTGQFRSVHDFSGKSGGDGESPLGGLAVANGALYGVTATGGVYDDGTFFRLTANGSETVLHSFAGTSDGFSPLYRPTYYKGMFYGATYGDGATNFGTVYRMSTSGSETVLHTFTYPGPSYPASGLAVMNGILYGTTSSGGARHLGTIYSVTPSGTIAILHEFAGKPSDAAYANGTELYPLNGTLYGVGESGGANDDGAFFSLKP